ncbi:MAG TPA: hypothetical protein VKE96_06105 [Vicinamibacterales bacterium]|nr:hypothetical protein [Vicinamibacterales bacterium]
MAPLTRELSLKSGSRCARPDVTSPDAADDSSSPSSSSSQASDALPFTSSLHSRSRAASGVDGQSTTCSSVDASRRCDADAGVTSTRPAHETSINARRAAAGPTNEVPMIVINALP